MLKKIGETLTSTRDLADFTVMELLGAGASPPLVEEAGFLATLTLHGQTWVNGTRWWSFGGLLLQVGLGCIE